MIISSPLLVLVVASFTDAWIETEVKDHVESDANVASFTDAWIETPAALVVMRSQ